MPTRSRPHKLIDRTYPLLWSAGLSLAGPWLLAREYFVKKDKNVLERLGLASSANGLPVWVHAASQGEFRAAQPLLIELNRINQPAYLTVMTPSSRINSAKYLSDPTKISYVPIDYSPCLDLFYKRVNPSALLTIETELWPLMIDKAFKRRIKLLMISGRLRKERIHHYKKYNSLFSYLLNCFDHLAMASSEDAERAILLGAKPSRVSVLGNIKILDPPPDVDLVNNMGRIPGINDMKRPLIIAASVESGEEEFILNAFQKASELSSLNPKLLLAPRKLNTSQEGLKLASKMGFCSVLRSKTSSRDWDVMILDSFGELKAIMPWSRAVIMGGTFAPVGGHSLLEPAVSGIPSIAGPHYHHFKEETLSLCHAGGAFIAGDQEKLTEILLELIKNSIQAESAGRRCIDWMENKASIMKSRLQTLGSYASGNLDKNQLTEMMK